MGAQAHLTVYQSVRCLECGSVYAKPYRGGTLVVEPGCPECGYTGWLPLAVPVAHGIVRTLAAVEPARHLPAS
jgi:hypothetical protein